MLYAASKVLRLFNIKIKTPDIDKILLAITLHDSMKYGMLGTRKHTDGQHDKNAADMIASNEKTFKKIFNNDQFFILETAVRFHSGLWSTDVPKNEKFDWSQYPKEAMFVHILDMLSTADCLITDVRE